MAVRSAIIALFFCLFNSILLFSQSTDTNKSIQLDGINSSVYLNQSGFQGTAYTLSGWVKKTKTGGQQYIIGNNTLNNPGTVFYIGPSGYFTHYSAGYIGTNVFVELNRWYHYVVIRNGNLFKIFIDGNLVTNGTYNLPAAAGGLFCLGDWYPFTAGDSELGGYMDDVAVWNRALSDNEALALRNCNAINVNDPTLRIYYDFNQSGTGNNLVVLNRATSTGTALNGTTAGNTTAPSFVSSIPPCIPTASISPATSQTACAGSQVTFTASPAGAQSYQWLLNGISIAGATNATYNATTPGNYSVQAVINGISSTSAVVAVNYLSNAPLVIAANQPMPAPCGASVTLTSSGGNFTTWHCNCPLDLSTGSTLTVNEAGSFTADVVSPDGCTTVSNNVDITFEQLQTDFAAPGTGGVFLTNTTIPFFEIVNENSSGLAYAWNFGNGQVSSVANPTISYASPGLYTVSLTVTNAYGCQASVTKNQYISVVDGNPNSFEAQISPTNVPVSCVGNGPILAAIPGDAQSYQWRLNGNAIEGATGSTYLANVSGEYSVVIVRSGTTRTSSAVTVTTVSPVSDFSSSSASLILPSNTVSFQAFGVGANSVYAWQFGNGTSSNEANPLAIYTDAGYYDVSLTINTPEGCTQTITKPAYIEVWNQFSASNVSLPNNFNVSSSAWLSPLNGCVALRNGGNNGICITTNGGLTWTPSATNDPRELRALRIAGGYSWIAGAQGLLCRSSNGGGGWTNVSPGITADINALQFTPDGNYGWLAGSSGTICRYVNGTWSPFGGIPSNYVFRSIYGGANWGFAVGRSGGGIGFICRYQAGAWQSIPGNFNGLNGVYFLNSQTGCAVGENATVLSTTDGGDTWNELTTGLAPYALNSVYCIDALNWICVGDNGLVLTTADGGVNFSIWNIGIFNNLSEVSVADCRVYITGDNGSVFTYDFPLATPAPSISVNGTTSFCAGENRVLSVQSPRIGEVYNWSTGETGTSITINGSGSYSVNAVGYCGTSASSPVVISVTAPQNYYADVDVDGYGYGAAVSLCSPQAGYVLVNGDCNDNNSQIYPGSSYTHIIDFTAAQRDLFLPVNQTTFSATVESSVVSYSWNFGNGSTSAVANPVATYTTPGFYTVTLTVTDNVGCTSTLSKSRYMRVWNVWPTANVSIPNNSNVTGSAWLSPYSGFVSLGNGGNYGVCITGNGGQSWTPSFTGDPRAIRTIRNGGSYSWIAGAQGLLCRSGNGGGAWQPYNLGIGIDINSLSFSDDGNYGWLGGTGGTICRYASNAWTPCPGIPTNYDFNAIYGRADWGYAVGASGGSGVICRYVGGNWVGVPGTYPVLYGTYFLNATNGCAVGANSTVLGTSDGGATWNVLTTGLTPFNLNAVYIIDALHSICVGDNGLVLLSDDGGNTFNVWNIGLTDDLTDCTMINCRVYITGANGGVYVYSSPFGTTLPAPIINSTTINPLCAGQTATFNVANPINGEVYTWSTDEIGTSILVSTGGSYSVTAAGICGSQNSNAISITVNQPINYYIDADGDGYGSGIAVAFCQPSAGYVTISGDCNDNNASVNPGAAEICNAIDDNCDGILLVASIAPTGIVASSTSVTSGYTVTLTVAGGSLGSSAQWIWYSGSCGGAIVGSGASISVNPTATTTFFVRAVGTCGNTACASVTVNVISNCAPTGITSTNASYVVCSGSSITLNVQGTHGSGATWRWYKNGCGSGTSVGSGASITVAPASSTTYFVRSEGGSCGTTACMSRLVTVNTIPSTPVAINGPATGICNAQQIVYSIAAVSGAASYNWTVPTGASILSGQGSTSITVNFSGTLGSNSSCGSASVCVRASNSCGNSGYRCLALSIAPATPASITGPNLMNTQQVATFSISAVSNATSYLWTVPSGWVILNGQGTTTASIRAGATSGNITVTAVNACGTSASSKKTVSVNCVRSSILDFNVWPNPAKDFITMNTFMMENYQIEIFNTIGQLMLVERNKIEIDVTTLSSGVYIVRLFDTENYYTTRLVIER